MQTRQPRTTTPVSTGRGGAVKTVGRLVMAFGDGLAEAEWVPVSSPGGMALRGLGWGSGVAAAPPGGRPSVATTGL